MKKVIQICIAAVFSTGLILAGAGCNAVTASAGNIDPRTPQHYDAKFDYTDLREITEFMTTSLLNSDFVRRQPEAPMVMIAGVQNRTSQYVDTKNLTDRMRTIIFKTGKMRFINEARRADLLKEQGYQAANATAATQVAVGKQLGAKYMMSGSLTEMVSKQPDQIRLSRKEIRYYKLTFEATDLETGELLWTDGKEFTRLASKPLIGW